MEILLWRWSTAIQVTSLVMIAAFHVALARSTPRAELRWWRLAWLANVAALAITLGFWSFDPPARVQVLMRFGYLWAKTTFVWLFLQGAWALLHPGSRVVRVRYALASITLFAAVGAALLRDVPLVGVAQHTLMALLLGFGAAILGGAGDASLIWLAGALAVRMLLAAVEAVAYALQLVSPDAPMSLLPPELIGMFLAIQPSLDTAAEWLLALGAVLAVSERAQRELGTYNQRLLDAQEDLRRLVDRDPLTALANRRALPEVFRAVQPQGAMVLFFDLDGFKAINDLYGHQTGDECLTRFADALRESFRPDDAVIRYAGDEFLVVASGLSKAGCAERVWGVRERLRRRSRKHGPAIRFSVGMAELEPGGKPEAALEAADQAMYRVKANAVSRPRP